MPILHLDSQYVRSTGQKLSFMSDMMYGEVSRLNTRLIMIQSSWTGNSSARFQEELSTAIGRLRRLADEADDLNRRLQRKVDEWEEVDRYF
jgi:uncharacterized protein YukE